MAPRLALASAEMIGSAVGICRWPTGWGRRAHQQAARFRAAGHRELVVRLPLEHAAAVIERVSARDELVSIQLYGHPWVMGEYWP